MFINDLKTNKKIVLQVKSHSKDGDVTNKSQKETYKKSQRT